MPTIAMALTTASASGHKLPALGQRACWGYSQLISKDTARFDFQTSTNTFVPFGKDWAALTEHLHRAKSCWEYSIKLYAEQCLLGGRCPDQITQAGLRAYAQKGYAN